MGGFFSLLATVVCTLVSVPGLIGDGACDLITDDRPCDGGINFRDSCIDLLDPTVRRMLFTGVLEEEDHQD